MVLCSLTQEMRLCIPNSQRINRGGLVLSELVETGRNAGFTDVIVLHEHRGEPGGKQANIGLTSPWIQPTISGLATTCASGVCSFTRHGSQYMVVQSVLFTHCSVGLTSAQADGVSSCPDTCCIGFTACSVVTVADGMVVCHLPYGPTAYFGIFNTVLRHDIGQKKEVGTISEAYPHLIIEKFSSQLGQRIANVLKYLFPVPKDDSKRVVTFANSDDFISFRHHTYVAPKGAKSIELKEVRGHRV